MFKKLYKWTINCRISGKLDYNKEDFDKDFEEEYDKRKYSQAFIKAYYNADCGEISKVETLKESILSGTYTFHVIAESETEALEKADMVFNHIWESEGIDSGDLLDIERVPYTDGTEYRCSGKSSINYISVTDINWDDDKQDVVLPREVNVPVSAISGEIITEGELVYEILNYLSEEYEYSVNGFVMDIDIRNYFNFK